MSYAAAVKANRIIKILKNILEENQASCKVCIWYNNDICWFLFGKQITTEYYLRSTKYMHTITSQLEFQINHDLGWGKINDIK